MTTYVNSAMIGAPAGADLQAIIDNLSAAGAWVVGDVIFHTNPTGANTGTRCTVAGSPGTWGLF